MSELTALAITHALPEIDPVFLHSPQFSLDALNSELGFTLTLKVETLNPIRSFKGRGTSLLVSRAEAGTKLVCASAGNFGQGMAYAGRNRGLPVTVFAAEGANTFKIERMRALGAEVIVTGEDFDAAKTAAKSYARAENCRFVEDSADIETVLGAGSIGVELTNLPEKLDAVLIPVGNGALINGIGTYLKAKSPATRVIGVVAAGAPAMKLSWEAKQSVATEQATTIADGIGVREPVDVAVQQSLEVVDEMVAVSDDAILAAMRLAQLQAGLVVEPAGAAGLAAAQMYQKRFEGQRAATILCGSNLTAGQLESWL